MSATRLTGMICALFVLGACGSQTEYQSGSLVRSCGPADEPTLRLALDDEAACDVASEPSGIVSGFFPYALDEPGVFELDASNRAQRCDEAGCVEVTAGTIELVAIDGDAREFVWSLELADGTVDQGVVEARACSFTPCP